MATWNELAARIMKMPEAERRKVAHYREPWDEAAEMFAVELREATEDLADPEGEVKVKKGEVFLQ